MATFLKQSTAVEIGIGPFLDETDGKTTKTALSITQPDIRLKKNGATWAQKNAAQTLSHEENGWYEISLDTTDTNTLGILLVAVHKATALPVWREFVVIPANAYESLVNGTEFLETTGVKPTFSISGATLTVKKVDGTTTQYTKTITATPGADPVTGLS